jgi:hypothetical protein
MAADRHVARFERLEAARCVSSAHEGGWRQGDETLDAERHVTLRKHTL